MITSLHGVSCGPASIVKKTARPPRFKVVLYNDDYTPMEFVVSILESLFGKGPAEATQIMLHIHRNGAGIAGVYVLEVAETKVVEVHKAAEERGRLAKLSSASAALTVATRPRRRTWRRSDFQ